MPNTQGWQWDANSNSYKRTTSPILPTWATDDDVQVAVDDIEFDFYTFISYCAAQAAQWGPCLADEIEAWLKH